MFNFNHLIPIVLIVLFPLAHASAEKLSPDAPSATQTPPGCNCNCNCNPSSKAEAPPPAATSTTAPTDADSLRETTPVQKPQVYKWTDAKGKTFYSQVKPPDVTQAQTVPVPQSTSNATSATDAPNTTNLTQRLNTQANQMAEERLAHARAMQELHRQDLNRIQQQQEYMSQQQSLAKQQEAAQALEGATQELERMKQELERKREHHTEEEHRYSYRPPSPPPLQAQTTIPEPPRPEWQPKPIPPFNPKEIGASR